MTQPLDTAYVEILPDTRDFSRTLDRDLDSSFRRLEHTATQAAENIEREWRRTSGRMGDSGESAVRQLRDVTRAAGQAGETLQEAFGAVTRGLSAVSGAIGGVVSGIGQIASLGPVGIAAAAAAFVALTAAAAAAAAVIQNLIIIAGAGLAALPGLALAAAAGFGVLKVATSGVMDAFNELSKETKSGGGAIVQSERQIAAAQRNIISAQRALNKAREDAKERIHDLRIELDRAVVSELRASQNLREANRALVEARLFGNPEDIRAAEVAVQEAEQAQKDAAETTRDTAREKKEADAAGVNGAENVLAAQERLLSAQDALAAAQQKVSAGAGAQREAFNGLTKSAQAFVLALVDAKTQLGPVADAIQEAFFSGTAPLIQPIVDNIKKLQPQLTKVSAAFGKIFQSVLKFLGSPEAEEAVGKILDGLANFLTAVEPAIGPLLEAFAGLAGQAGEFGDELGTFVKDGLLGIADFVKNVDLKQLFADAKVAINELLPLVKPLLSIIKDLFFIFADAGKFILPAIALDLKIISVVVGAASDAFDVFLKIITPVFNFIKNEGLKVIKNVSDAIGGLPDKITGFGPKLLKAAKSFISNLWTGLGTAGGFVADFSKKIANSVIGFINNYVISPINSGIQRIEDGLNGLPFFSGINLPSISRIPGLEKGGIVTQEMLIRAGEKGRREGVIPLESPGAMREIGRAIADAGGADGSGGIVFSEGSIVISFEGTTPTPGEARETGRAVGEGIAEILARRNTRFQVRTL